MSNLWETLKRKARVADNEALGHKSAVLDRGNAETMTTHATAFLNPAATAVVQRVAAHHGCSVSELCSRLVLAEFDRLPPATK
jgi:hypothetical protein